VSRRLWRSGAVRAGWRSGPTEAPESLDILPLSVGTDPGLAMKTRKGTGYYKVPSLKGVWYRGHYLHDGAVSSLEEMFDPDRVTDTHSPGGVAPPREHHARCSRPRIRTPSPQGGA
jgi:hypothetical protein